MFRSTIAALVAASAYAAAGIDYTTLGANWGETDPLCDTGLEQSPIDLTYNASTSDTMSLVLENYTDFEIDTTNPDLSRGEGSVYVPLTDGDFTLTFPDGTEHIFEVLQLHFHAPSEHTVNGEHKDLEVHFVHLYADGSLGGVIGVFFDRTAGNEDNEFLTGLWAEGDTHPINVKSFLTE